MTTLIEAPVRLLLTPRARVAPNNKVLAGNATLKSLDFNRMGAVDYVGQARGRVAGTVKEFASPSNLPRKRMVYLHRQRDGRRVGAKASDPATGAYAFDNIDTREQYFVLAFDHTLNYNAVIRSDITPEVMV